MAAVAVVMVVGLVAGAVVSQSMQPSNNQSDYATKINTTGVEPEIPVVYGKTRVGGHRIFNEVVASDEDIADTATFIFSLGHGEINAIRQLYIDELPLFKTERAYASGVVGHADIRHEFASHVQCEISTGNEVGYRHMMAEANSDGRWTPEHLGKGIVTICLKIKLDQWEGKIKHAGFNLTALVEGQKVNDIRQEGNPLAYRLTTGKAVGRNPALCLLDYLRNTHYGCGFTSDELDFNSFIVAANWCDAHKLYMDGVVNQRQAYKKNIEDMLTSMGGILVDIEGVIQLKLDIASPVTKHFNKDNIIDTPIKVKYDNPQKYFNQLEATWTNPQNQYKKDITSYPPNIQEDETIQRDGRVIGQRLVLPYTKKKDAVDFLATKACKKAQDTSIITFKADVDGFLTNVWDVVSITHEDLNFVSKKFRILGIKRNLMGKVDIGTVDIEAIEYTDSAYVNPWVGVTPTVTTVQDYVNPVSNLKFNFFDSAGGLNAELSWDYSGHKVRETNIYYRIHGTDKTQWRHYKKVEGERCILTNLQALHYDFMVINLNIFNKASEPKYLLNVNLEDATVIPAVTNLAVDPSGKTFKVSWDDMSEAKVQSERLGELTVLEVMAGYEVSVYKSGKLKRKYVTGERTFNYTFEQNEEDTLSRYVRFDVRIITPFGGSSPVSTISGRNEQHGLLDGMEIVGGLGGLRIYWDRSIEDDYDYTEVHVSKTPNFTASSSTLYKTFKGTECLWQDSVPDFKGWVYIRLGATDVFGGKLTYSKIYESKLETIENKIEAATSSASSQAVLEALTKVDETMTLKHKDKWGVTLDNKGLISGVAMVNDGTTSSFAIRASTFSIYNGEGTMTPFTVHDNQVLIKDAVIGDLDAEKITTGYLNSARIRAHSITTTHLDADTITALSASFDIATIEDATIGFAKIKDDIQSQNYVQGSRGWRLSKGGYFEANDAHFRGTITGSYIRGAFIEGGLIAGGTNFVITTQADTGVQPRKMCLAGRRGSGSVGAGSAGWGRIANLPIASADYTGDGYTSYTLSNGVTQKVCVDFNRLRKFPMKIEGSATLNTDFNFNQGDLNRTVRIVVKVSGIRGDGSAVVLNTATLYHRNFKARIGKNTETAGLKEGWGGSVRILKKEVVSYHGKDDDKRVSYQIKSVELKVNTSPLHLRYEGNFKKLQIQLYTAGAQDVKDLRRLENPCTHVASWTVGSR